jgi:hypothetical protein
MSRLRNILLVTALALGGTLVLPTGALASKGQWSVFEDHTALVKSPVDERIRRLNEVKELGVDTLRIEVKWNEVAPDPGSKTKPSNFDASDPGAYASHPNAYPGFGGYDDLVVRARNLGFRIILTVTGDAPRWATQGGLGTGTNVNYRPSSGEYANFAAAVAKRYSGVYAGLPAVFYYTIWNEPNHRQFIKPTKSAPGIYRNMVDAATWWMPRSRRSGPPTRPPRSGSARPRRWDAPPRQWGRRSSSGSGCA